MRYLMSVAMTSLLVTAPHVARAGGGPEPRAGHGYACYASFSKDRDGRGPTLTRKGPEAIPDLDYLRYANGETLDADVLSVATGPGAWLELFDKTGYRRLIDRIGPGQAINLRDDDTDSYRLYCHRPDWW